MSVMEIKFKARRTRKDALTEPYTIPVSQRMKEQLNRMKVEAKIDINAMTREFFLKVIEEIEVAPEPLDLAESF